MSKIVKTVRHFWNYSWYFKISQYGTTWTEKSMSKMESKK